MPDTALGLSSVNSALLKRPRLAWVIAALVLLSNGRALNRLDLNPEARWWWSVLAFVIVGYSAVTALSWPRIAKRRPAEVISNCWAMALGGALMALAAVVAELTDLWVYWAATAVTLTVLAVMTRAAVSDRVAPDDPTGARRR